MMPATVAVWNGARKLGFRVRRLGVYPISETFEIKLETNVSPIQCNHNFRAEMRDRGFILTNMVFISHTHFITKIIKIE